MLLMGKLVLQLTDKWKFKTRVESEQLYQVVQVSVNSDVVELIILEIIIYQNLSRAYSCNCAQQSESYITVVFNSSNYETHCCIDEVTLFNLWSTFQFQQLFEFHLLVGRQSSIYSTYGSIEEIAHVKRYIIQVPIMKSVSACSTRQNFSYF